jgi:phosphomevalonate kinase
MQNRVGASLFAVSIASVLLAKVVAPFFKTKTNPHQKRISCISAPGKVLIAGGYLVLEHPNLGISIATTSRFYTTVQPKLLKEGVPTYANCITIIVDSPQFYEQYTYIYNIVTHNVTAIGKEHKNEFVEKCISLTMAFISQFKQKDGSGLGAIVQALNGTHYLSILLQAHNDFYSQIKEVCSLLAVNLAVGGA